MAVINSYYLYQKYEKRGNQPWIPSYPNTWSIDGDGTMPPVLKQQDDPSCYHPIYRWVQTEDTICIDTTSIDVRTTSGTPYCDGYDKYVDTTTEQSFDGGVTWEFVSSASTLVEQDSEYCGYHPTPEVQYRWTESGTTCDNANKYKRYIKEVSYDGGYAWIVVTPPQYSAGTLVEADSYDCGYRTSATTSATYCSNANQYVDVYSLVSRDYGVTWSTASTSTELIEEDVVECGFSARTISTATTCVGVDKHYLDEYQESRNTGTTWTTISSSTGSLIESNSYDCGYRTGTTSGDPYCQGYDKYVDVYYRTSTDGGTTWVTASTTPTLVEAQSEDCGYVPPTPTQYRWTQSGTTCVGYDKYQNNIKEQSTDGGTTWTVVIPEEYSASTLIESQSTDCGYVPPTPSGNKFTLTLSDSSTVTAACDSTSAITSGEVSSQYSGSVVSAEIGECVTSVGRGVFEKCGRLTSCTIPDSVTEILYYAFKDCTSLKTITIPNSVTTIGAQSFINAGLTSITIPSGVTSIGTWAFSYCPFTSMTVDSNNTVYDSRNNCNAIIETSTNALLYGCRNTVIPNTVAIIGSYAFERNNSLTSIVIPDSVVSIRTGAFISCKGLTSITIPDSVTDIWQQAFEGCDSVTSVTIGSGITSIGNSVFGALNSVQSITCLATRAPSLGSNVFYSTNDCPIYVPSGSVNDYKAVWSSYSSRIQAIPNS